MLREKASERDMLLIKSLLAYQIDPTACRILSGRVEVTRSPTTGRIREIYVDGELLGTIRATDGFFVPSLEGAKRLLKALSYPKLRVVVPFEVAIYVARGRTVFCKHVLEADPDIRPGDEVIVVDTEDKLVAVGKAILSAEEILTKKVGRAVKVRKGYKNYQSIYSPY